MAKPKKNGTYLNVCIDSSIYERLNQFSEDAGQSKTVAVERALTAYLDDYAEKQRKLKEIDGKYFRVKQENRALKAIKDFEEQQ